MAKIKLHKYHMDPEGKYHVGTAALMGASFFLRCAYYFGFTRPESAGAWNLLVFLILPMLLEAAVMVMIRGMKMDLPSVYGIMGAVYCGLLILQSFQVGGFLRIVLAILGFVICGGALVGVGWGLLSKSLAVTALLVGMSAGVTVAVISPVCAFVLGIAPNLITVLPIMLGNVCYVVLLKVLMAKPFWRQITGLVAAAVAKFAVLYVLVVGVICGAASGILLGQKLGQTVLLAPPMLKMLPAMFTWPQLITALVGGALALMIYPVVKKGAE